MVINDPATTPGHRSIRSFVLRQGRFSPAQRRAYESLLSRFGIAFATVPLDLGISFLNCSIYILEPAQGAIVIPISAGVLELGCNLV